MNERIRELAKRAGAGNRAGVSGLVFRDEELQKFAELMAREAIAVVQKRFMGDFNREDMEIRRCVADLKKHFGVE